MTDVSSNPQAPTDELVCALSGSAHRCSDVSSCCWHHPVTDSRADLLRLHRDAILELLAARGIEDVRIFGSIARGDDEPTSDIDLIVELRGERSSGAELLEALELSELLTRLVGARVDVVTPRSLRREVRELAIAEAVPLRVVARHCACGTCVDLEIIQSILAEQLDELEETAERLLAASS